MLESRVIDQRMPQIAKTDKNCLLVVHQPKKLLQACGEQPGIIAYAGTAFIGQVAQIFPDLCVGHTRRVARYRCDTCGFKARQFYWQCAGCNRWDTYAPKRSEELGA